MSTAALLLVAGLTLLPVGGAIAGSRPAVRHAGRVQSLIPHQGLLIIREDSAAGRLRTLRVDIRNAEVVHVTRDPARPWRWRDHPARIARLPVGSFVVVIGEGKAPGIVDADRIEVPW